MNIYKELGLKTIINASDTYTKIGGSRMDKEILDAMCEAAGSFIDIIEMGRRVNASIAKITNNESAFVSSGAAACMILTASSLMTKGDPELIRLLPDTSKCEKNEIIVFKSQTEIPMLPYWHLIELSGAKLVRIPSTIEALSNAVTEKTAGIFYFLADFYELGLPPLEDIIELSHNKNIKVIIDAAAQLPPKSNMWHYTKNMGADGIIFSGGKFIKGPQSTGLFLGSEQISRHFYDLANPNVSIGRPFKVGKEEFAAIYAAVKYFIETNENKVKTLQNSYLDIIENKIKNIKGLSIARIDYGRLGQDIPMLIIDLPDGKAGDKCAKFMYDHCDPAIDIGYYKSDDPTGKPNQIFVNPINLRENELSHISDSIKRFLDT